MVTPRFLRTAAILLAVMVAAPAAMADSGEKSMGKASAKVTVIEYASVTCPHCGRFNNEVFPAFKAKYVDTGKVLYVFREFPTDPAELAAAGFLVARCAPADKYFPVLDALFHGQDKLYQTRDAKAWLLEAAKVGGMDEAKAQACIEDKAALDAFNTRVEAAFNVGKIQSTPTFVIGKTKLEGEQTLAALSAAIDPLLGGK
ncbi:MAG TPA: DsbA family protein [Caulobacteraceae bacterium]|jgi:protein-disulfide isomerase|nr:DsbA family protein [Caulobacteraceae bacterium]